MIENREKNCRLNTVTVLLQNVIHLTSVVHVQHLVNVPASASTMLQRLQTTEQSLVGMV